MIWASLSRHGPRERRVFHLTFSAIVLIAIVIGLACNSLSFRGLFRASCGIVQHTFACQSCHRRRTRTHHQNCSDCKRRCTFAGVSIWICWARGANIRDGEHSRSTLVARVSHSESREGLSSHSAAASAHLRLSISVMNRSNICRSCMSIGRIMTGWSRGSRAAGQCSGRCCACRLLPFFGLSKLAHSQSKFAPGCIRARRIDLCRPFARAFCR